MRRRPIRDSLGRSEARADELTVAGATLAHLIAIWSVDRLVVSVVKLFLVHVEPDARPLRPRRSLLRRGTGLNYVGGGISYNGPAAHRVSFAAIAAHRSSG